MIWLVCALLVLLITPSAEADRGWKLESPSSAPTRILDSDANPSCATDAPTLRMWSLFDGSAGENCLGGGSSTPPDWQAQAASTANVTISNPGTAVFDGVTLTSGLHRLLLWQQTTQSENGLYLFNGSGSALTRAPEANDHAEYTVGRTVLVLPGGTLYGGNLFLLSNTSAVTLGSSNVNFFRLALGTKTESTANKSLPGATIANGYVGASATGRLPWGSFGEFAQHANLAAANTATATQPTMGVQSSSGTVNLTSDPNLAAGTYHGQRVRLKGTHDTQLITWEDESTDANSGILLCGRTGGVTTRLGFDDLQLEWNAVLSKWEEVGCQGLDRVARVGKVITGLTSTGTAVCLGQDANNCTRFYFSGGENRIESVVGGSVSVNSTIQLGSGGSLTVKKSDGTDLFKQANDTGVVTGVSLDDQGTGNTLTISEPHWRPAAGCNGSTPSPIWDLPVTNPAVAACVSGTNTQKGVLEFADGSNLSAQLTEKLPPGWTGDIVVNGKWVSTTASTNTVVWQIQSSCVADGEADDPAWDTDVLVITDAGKGTTGLTNNFTGTLLASSHLSGCAAGELLHLKLFRDSAHASDNFAGTARLIGVEFIVREAK